jgi:heme exporter protein B
LVLAVIFSLEGLFRSDYQDGSLALWALQPSGLARYALMRLLAIWAVQLLPLMLVSPLMALAFGLNLQALPVLFLTELLALPILLLVGASLSALTLTARSAGLLNALLALPLFLPVLIFAASALERAQEGLAVAGPLYLLASVLCLTLVLAPWAIQASLRLSVRRG